MVCTNTLTDYLKIVSWSVIKHVIFTTTDNDKTAIPDIIKLFLLELQNGIGNNTVTDGWFLWVN